jgi:hypothetical protein
MQWLDSQKNKNCIQREFHAQARLARLKPSKRPIRPLDGARFVYRQITGDFDIRVRISSLANTHSAAKAGLMAREFLTTGSKHALVAATPGTGAYRWAYRLSTGGGSNVSSASSTTYPDTWVRLVRIGNTITGYYGQSGVDWTQIGTYSISTASLYVGLATTSHNTSSVTTAEYRDLFLIQPS